MHQFFQRYLLVLRGCRLCRPAELKMLRMPNAASAHDAVARTEPHMLRLQDLQCRLDSIRSCAALDAAGGASAGTQTPGADSTAPGALSAREAQLLARLAGSEAHAADLEVRI